MEMIMQWELILEKSLTSLPQNVLQALNSYTEKDSYTIVVTKQFAKTAVLFL